MNYSLAKIEKFLSENTIPKFKDRPKTFLEISKQPHYENVWSNIYSFYFKQNEEHNLGDLFLRTLLELINCKHFFCNNNIFSVYPEYPAKNMGRIDLLLYNDTEAIIIENKVNHILANDLENYWDSVTQNNKVGVILSLHKMSDLQIGNSNYTSITHCDFLERVIKNLPVVHNGEEKYIIFLKDFYQNVMNVTNNIDAEIVKFFFRNHVEINQISNIKEGYISYVISEVEKACENVESKLEFYKRNNSKFRHYICSKERNLMFTVVFTNLFLPEQSITIVVELQNDLLKKVKNDRSIISNIEFDNEEKNILRNDFYNSRYNWSHFATIVYRPTENDILNLSNYISTTINSSPLLTIYKKLEFSLVSNTKEKTQL